MTPEWEAEQLQDFQQTRRLTVVPALSRSSTLGPFRIYAHFLDMTALPASNITFIQQQVIPSAIKWYYNVLRVYNLAENWRLSQTTCSSAVNVPKEHQNPGLSNTDYVLYVYAVNEPAKNYIAKGGFCALDGNSLTNPIAGTLGYNAAFYVALTPEQEIMTARHEIAHALAFSPSMWPYFRQPDGSLYSSYTITVTERGHSVTLLTFPKTLARARTAFGCSTMQGIELENQGAVGTSGSHWEKRLMANDFMVGTLIIDMLYSDVTLALFEDSGWYTVNYDYTTPTTWGHEKGCDFVNLNCVSGGVTKFSEWCTAADDNNACSSTNTIKASCNYATYGTALTSFYQYFANPNNGGQDSFTDYCPYAVPFSDGDCKGRGYAATWFSAASFGEKICDTCMCFTGTTVRVGRSVSGTVRALCYDVACSDTVATITLGSTSIACPAAGGQLTNIPDFTGYLNCPPYSELCGTRPCINGCWGAGKCINGVCQCDDGYSGVDCSTICHSSCRKCTGTGNTMCSACYSGGVLNTATGTCPSCDVSCATCSGPAANQCSTCVSDATLTSGSCICDNGFARSSDKTACVSCHSSCSKCSADSLATQCTACRLNAALPVGLTSGSCTCNTGFYMTPEWNCAQCPATCKSCQSAEACSSCHPITASISLSGVCICPSGFYLSPDFLSCLQCHQSCLTCSASGPNFCLSCKPGTASVVSGVCVCPVPYYLASSGSECSGCDSSCASCGGSGNMACRSCYPGGVLSPSEGPGSCGCTVGKYYSVPVGCLPCYSTCKTCTGDSATHCSSCYSGTISLTSECQCGPGFYTDDSNNCLKCSANCLSCDISASQCTSCDTTFSQLVATECQCLPSAYKDADTSCKSCDPTCLTCSNGLASACLSCRANATKKGGNCECNDGFYWVGSLRQCKDCSVSCLTCSGGLESNCETCLSNATKQNDGTCQCNSSYFKRNDGSCAQCPALCSTCNSSNCLTCTSPAILQTSKCVCPSHQYLDTTQCLNCDTACLNCSGAGASNCASCYNQGILTPAAGPGTCSCASGKYYSPPSGCMPCNVGCKDCAGALANQCLSCNSGATLSGESPTSCVCNIGLYLESTGICQTCSQNCQACLGSSATCTSCNTQTSKLTTNTCTCLDGYYKSSSGSCLQCDPFCLTCSTGSSQGCLSCYSSATMGTMPGACRCPTGYFANVSSRQCQVCDPSCKECSGATASLCTACVQYAGLNSSGNCQCFPGYYMDNSSHTCKSCSPVCRTCSGAEASACQSCYSQAQLTSTALSTCECVSGTTPKPTAANCSVGSCDSSCLTCRDTGAGQCLSCNANAIGQGSVFPTSCICGSGFYPNPNTANCAACDLSCLTCSGFSSFQCLTCPSSKVLVSGLYCSDVCPSGQMPLSGVCGSSSSAAVFRLSLDKNTQILMDSAGMLKAYAGSAPSSDQSDPVAYYQQGWLFDGIGTYITLPPNTIETRSLLLDATHTVEMWTRIASLGNFVCLLSKSTPGNQEISQLLRLCITDANQISLSLTIVSQADSTAKQIRSVVGGSLVSTNVWISVVYKVVFSSQTGSTVKIILNNNTVQTALFPKEMYKDSLTNSRFLIGATVSPPPSLSMFLKGNIAEISIYNADLSLSPAACNCPTCTTASLCLSPCLPNEYPVTPRVCQACASSCTTGCIRGTDCSLNVDQLCMSFTDFTGCSACKERATSSATGVCQCVANAEMANGACFCVSGYQQAGNLCVQCRPYFHPSEITANFDSSYLTFTIQFNRPVAIGPVSTCESLFFPSTLTKLGQGSRCSWSADQKSVTTQLGLNATLSREALNLNYVNLYSTQGNCSYSAIQLSPLPAFPNTPSPIQVNLIAPKDFSLACNIPALDLDASGTIGGRGRNMDFSWTVRSEPFLPSLSLYAKYASTSSVLSIPSALLSEAVITAVLTVRNFFGGENSTFAVIQVTAKPAIALFIEGGSEFEMFASQKRLIRAIPREICSNLPLQYTWSLVSANPTGNSPFYVFLASASPPNTIKIPENTLIPGTFYNFSVQATSGASSGTAFFSIKVLRSPLIARLNRISSESGINASFIISGSQSYDPDGGNLVYLWRCFEGNFNCVDSTGALVVEKEQNPSLTIPSFKLKAGAKWRLILTISNDFQAVSASVLISFLANPACDFSVSRPLAVRISALPTLQIALKAATSVPTSFQWSQIHGNSLQFLTPTSYAYMVIAGDYMVSGAEYGFSLTATNTAGTNSAQVYFTVNYPPSGGTVGLTPVVGTAVETVFTVQGRAWEDVEGDYPLAYLWTYGGKGRQVALGRASMSTLQRVKLAAGTFDMQLTIIDTMGGQTPVTLPTVSVSLSENQLQSSDIIQAFLTDILDFDQTFPMVIAYSNSYNFTNATFEGILSQLVSYVSLLPGIENSEIEAAISCFEALFRQKSALLAVYLRTLLKFIDYTIAKSSIPLTTRQISDLSGIIGTYTGNSTDCLSDLQQFLQKLVQTSQIEAMPDQAATLISSPVMTSFSQRISSESFRNFHFSTGNSSFSFPENPLSNQNLPASSVFDVLASTLARPEGSSHEVTITVKVAGSWDDYEFQRTNIESEVTFRDLIPPINFSVPMNSYSGNETYDCMYLKSDGNWSSLGLNLTSISAISANCSTTHLSTFQVRPRPESTNSPVPLPVVFPSTDCQINFAPMGEVAGLLLIGLLATVVLRTLRDRMHLEESAAVLTSERIPEDLIPNSAPERAPPSSPALLPGESGSKSVEKQAFLHCWRRAHGVLGLFVNEEKPRLWSKVLRLTTVLVADMCIIGAFYDENDSENSQNTDEIWSNYSASDFSYAVISLVCGFCLSLLLSLLFSLPTRLPSHFESLAYSNTCALCIFLCFSALAGTIYQSSVLCSEAAGRWAISLLPVLAGEVLIVQSVLAVVRAVGSR